MTIRNHEDAIAGCKLGMDMAVSMAREGNLRLAALPFEKGEFPHKNPIRPWKITKTAWTAWWREKRA